MTPKDGLYVSKSNRRAVLVLLLVLLVIAFSPRVYFLFKGKDTFVVSKEILAANQSLTQENKKRSTHHIKKKSKYKSPPSKFDPNLYRVADWMRLGLSEKQAGVIVKFAGKGLNTPEDLKKIFVVSDELFELIKDSIVFENKRLNTSVDQKTFEKKRISLDLNNSTKEQLTEINGIGEYIGDRIVAYRERLGGYAAKEQLMEIKKIDLELYSRIEDQLIVDPNFIRKLNINQASAEELKNHPYISWNVANSIVKMRSQKVSYNRIEELLESALIDRELFEKIKPYITL